MSLFSLKLKGNGGVYVIFMLGIVSGLSFLMTDGVLPDIERNPKNPEVVQIEDQEAAEPHQNLQLVNIGIKLTETPTPTPSPDLTPVPETPTPLPDLSNCPGNLLINPSFEVDSVDTNPPTGWQSFGIVLRTPQYDISDGIKYARVFGQEEMLQRVPVVSGGSYRLTFYYGTHATPGTFGRQTVSLEYLSSSYTRLAAPVVKVIDHSLSDNTFAGPALLTLAQAPANAAFVQVRVRDEGFESAKVDDFCLQRVGG